MSWYVSELGRVSCSAITKVVGPYCTYTTSYFDVGMVMITLLAILFGFMWLLKDSRR